MNRLSLLYSTVFYFFRSNPHGDFNPGAIQSLKESIHIHLYDEKLVDIIDDDRLRETNIHQRLEKHWLASLRIPFAALYYNSRVGCSSGWLRIFIQL